MRYILWDLAPAALPILAVPPNEYFHYLRAGEGVDARRSWYPARSSDRGRFVIPSDESDLEDFLGYLEEGAAAYDGVVYIAWRHTFQTGGLLVIEGGAVIIPADQLPADEILEGNREDLRAQLTSRVVDLGGAEVEASREAEQRSLRLLGMVLNEEQRQSVWDSNQFTMTAHERTFLVTKGLHGNVYELDDDGKRKTNYCIYIEQGTLYDQMMAQKLMIEHDLESFLRIANAKEVGPPPTEEEILQWRLEAEARAKARAQRFVRLVESTFLLQDVEDEWCRMLA